MKLEQSFEVAAPIDQVWAALNDLERVAPCLPGAAITEHDDDGTYSRGDTPPEAAKPVGGFGLFFSVLWERIRRRFGRSRGPR
jgi:hypothetical protein